MDLNMNDSEFVVLESSPMNLNTQDSALLVKNNVRHPDDKIIIQDLLNEKTVEDLKVMLQHMQMQIQGIYQDLCEELMLRDSLIWQVQFRYITIEQLFKNQEKLNCFPVSEIRALV
ncbi:uncharacterized protein O3C94_014415 [Discoglossus pictus]